MRRRAHWLVSTPVNETWHMLPLVAGNGAWHMACDLYLARIWAPRRGVPILRFYTWSPYALSLGHAQPTSDVDLVRCQTDGVDVVKRPTGGRAVLHAEELTYSVAIPARHEWTAEGVLKLYQKIARALTRGLGMLGVVCQPVRSQEAEGKSSGSAVRTSMCFASVGRYEITAGGAKMVGSAQRRFREGVLQHGSILVGDHHTRLPAYLHNGAAEGQGYLKNHTTSLKAELGRVVSSAEIAEALQAGFEAEHSIRFHETELDAGSGTQIAASASSFDVASDANLDRQ